MDAVELCCNTDVNMTASSLEDKQQLVDEFYEALGDVVGTMQRNEDRLASHHALGAAANDHRHVDKIKVNIDTRLQNVIK